MIYEYFGRLIGYHFTDGDSVVFDYIWPGLHINELLARFSPPWFSIRVLPISLTRQENFKRRLNWHKDCHILQDDSTEIVLPLENMEHCYKFPPSRKKFLAESFDALNEWTPTRTNIGWKLETVKNVIFANNEIQCEELLTLPHSQPVSAFTYGTLVKIPTELYYQRTLTVKKREPTSFLIEEDL